MGLWKKAAAVIATATLIFGLVGTAFAATPENITAGANRMHELGLVNGKDTANPNDLQLGDSITRAELMTILVRAFGYKDAAEVLKGANAFPDTATHWASGYIQVAKNIIVEKNHYEMGMPDGTFAPDGKVTAAQAVAFLMKFIGVAPGTEAWPNNYLNAAVSAGLLSAADRDSISANANQEATRGLVFYLADQSFYSYPLADGKTVYTKYVKPQGPSVTLESIDATTDALSVTITGKVSTDATEVFVGSSSNKVTVGAGGSFTYTHNLVLGPNDIVVTAKDIAGNSTSKTLSTTRTTGTAATIAASLSSQMVKAGATANLTVKISDKNGTELAGLTPVVTVTGNIGTYADGVFTAATTSGATGKLTVSYEQAAPVDIEVAVVAADLDHIAITPATPSVGIGTPIAFAAKGVDAYGNDVAIESIQWTKTGGIIDTTGTFVGTTAGTYTVTATAGGKTGTATVTVFGAPSAIRLAAISDFTANKESTRSVTATVVDANGSVATGYTGKVNFTVSDSTKAKLSSASIDATAGVATVTLTSNGFTEGTFVVSASAPGLTGTTVNAKALVQKLTSIKSELAASTIYADGISATDLTFTELDQDGVEMNTATHVDIKITNDNDHVASVGTTAAHDATTPVRSAGSTQGTANLSFAVTTSGLTSIPVSPISIATTPVGIPASVAVDTIKTAKVDATGVSSDDMKQYITVRLLDDRGNQVTTPTLNTNTSITISTTNATADFDGTTPSYQLTATHAPSNGQWEFTVTNEEATEVSYKVTASWDPDGGGSVPAIALTSTTATGSFLPGPVRTLTLKGSPNTSSGIYLSADGVATGSLTATVSDSRGNAITDGSYTVTFKKYTDNNATADFTDNKYEVATGGGSASATITATKAQATDTFQATMKLSDGTIITSGSLNVTTSIMGVVTTATTDSPSTTWKAGASKDVTVTVKDAAGHPVTTDNGRTVTINAYKGTTNLGTFTGSTVNGVATIPVSITKTGSIDFKATVDGVTGTFTDSSTVSPADAAKIVLESDLTTLLADNTSTATLTVTLKDQYDNATADNGVDIKVSVDSLTYGTFQGTTEKFITLSTAGGTKSTAPGVNDLKATTAPGTINITAKGPDTSTLTEGTLTISTIFGGTVADHFAFSTIENGTAGSTTGQEVTVKVFDYQGNHITSYDEDATVTVNKSGDFDSTSSGLQQSQTVTFAKGIATFTVFDSKAETVEYTIDNAAMPELKATAVFDPAKATHLSLSDPSRSRIVADGGDVVTYSVYVEDANHNTVSSASGTVNLEITSGADYAVLPVSTISIAGGIGAFQVQSKYRESDGVVTVSASTTDMFKADGTTKLDSGTNSGDLTVDGTKPTVTSAVWDYSAKTLSLTFSEQVVDTQAKAAGSYVLTGVTLDSAVAITYNTTTHAAVLTFTAAPAGGNKVQVSGVHDIAGNAASFTATVPSVTSATWNNTDKKLTLVFAQSMTEADVESDANYTVGTGAALTASSIVYTDSDHSAVYTFTTVPSSGSSFTFGWDAGDLHLAGGTADMSAYSTTVTIP